MSSNKVFGLGFSKTGTTSLENVYDVLGYNVCRGHWNLKHNDYLLSLYVNGDYKEIYKMTKYWDAFADGPWGGGSLYKKLYEWYPDAKYILTVRDSEKWYQSIYNMITTYDKAESTAMETYHSEKFYGSAYFFRHIFNITELENSKEAMINYFEATNKEIISFFEDKNNLLVIDLTKNNSEEKWEKICKYLDKPIPEIEFPHSNVGKPDLMQKESNIWGELKGKIKRKSISLINKL